MSNVNVYAYRFAFVATLLGMACPAQFSTDRKRSAPPRTAVPEDQELAPPSRPGRIVLTGPTSINIGARATFSATALYASRTESITGRATWRSSDNAVASVSSSGVVRGRTEGSASITATFSGVSGSVSVHIKSVVRGSGRPRAGPTDLRAVERIHTTGP